MKCWTHPKMDAVAVCVSCGKGLCKECSIVIAGNTYCKTCVESEKWRAPPTPPPAAPPTPPPVTPPTPPPTAPPTPPPTPPKAEPTPTPTRRPSKAQFTVGGIGSVFNVIASIPLLILAAMLLNTILGVYTSAPQYYEEVWIFWPFGGIIMAGIGYLGIRRNYGSAMGIASFAFAIVTLVLLVLFSLAGIALYYEYPEEWATAQVIQGIWFIPFGIMQILWGATHIVTRKFTGKSGLSLATGVMLILAGSLTMTLILSFLGMALFFVAEIMASVLFFTSKIPTVPKP